MANSTWQGTGGLERQEGALVSAVVHRRPLRDKRNHGVCEMSNGRHLRNLICFCRRPSTTACAP